MRECACLHYQQNFLLRLHRLRNHLDILSCRIPDPRITGVAGVLIICNDTYSRLRRITMFTADSIKPFSIAILLQGAQRTNQRLPGLTTQTGCTEGFISNEGVKRVSSPFKGNKPSLIVYHHSETDPCKIRAPIGW